LIKVTVFYELLIATISVNIQYITQFFCGWFLTLIVYLRLWAGSVCNRNIQYGIEHAS
jgi:hypothetical protein